MGSSDSGGVEATGVVDGRPGTIVWVRRRNGSWWPGRILGSDDISIAHLMSPRSGTPVKLLGREDASVDWYNLEKSKRVKAFRCGEFDDCIEKAEAALGLPMKKREKYARREDAILHALELEKQFLPKKYGKVGSSSSLREKSSDSERKNLATSSVPLANGNGKLGQHQPHQLVKKVDTSNMLEKNIPLVEQKSRDASRLRLQEHNTDASQRTRGLQEFGLRTVPVNGMIYTSATSDDSKRMTIDDHAYDALINIPCLGNSSDSGSRNSIGKGKRLLEGFVGEPPPKRHDRHHVVLPDHRLQPDGGFITMYEKEQTVDSVHRSLYLPSVSPDKFDTNHDPQGQLKMFGSRLEVGNSHLQHDTLAEESTSVSSEETKSDSSETHSLERHVDARMMQSDAETPIRVQPSTFAIIGGLESTSCDESDEHSLDDGSQFYPQGPNPSGFGVSKWQLKGKRNIRNFSKRPMDRLTHRTYNGRDRSLTQRAPDHSLSYYHENDYNNAHFIDDDFYSPTYRLGTRGYLPSQATTKKQYFVGQNMIDWEDLAWGRPFRGYWEDRGQNGHEFLMDVDVKVQANRQGEHVPWVSLMSRLNGQAIIGHPIQIETVEDGSTDILVSTSDISGVPPVWRTARRTSSFRVPHPHPSSQLDGDDLDAEIHLSEKVQSKKSVASSSLHRCSTKKKMKKKLKPTKKGISGSNQKTKALSSIGNDQKINKRHDKDTCYMDGIIKPVDAGPQAVACIPVKLVFSRLLEAIGRPPSGSVIVKHKERNPP